MSWVRVLCAIIPAGLSSIFPTTDLVFEFRKDLINKYHGFL